MSPYILPRDFNDPNDEWQQQNSLTVGAWIGIVIAILVVKIGLIVFCCYLCKRRDRQRRLERMGNPLYTTPGYAPPPYAAVGTYGPGQTAGTTMNKSGSTTTAAAAAPSYYAGGFDATAAPVFGAPGFETGVAHAHHHAHHGGHSHGHGHGGTGTTDSGMGGGMTSSNGAGANF